MLGDKTFFPSLIVSLQMHAD